MMWLGDGVDDRAGLHDPHDGKGLWPQLHRPHLRWETITETTLFLFNSKGECREMFAPFFHDSNPSWTLIHIMKFFHMCEKTKQFFLHDLWMVLKVSMVEFFRQSHIRKCQSEAQTGWFNERDKIGGKISWCCPFNGLNPYWNGTGTSLDQITNYQPNLFYQTSDWNM